ncbi:MAG: hypothetical protein U0792_04070 [Gemmataceae bacterium]
MSIDEDELIGVWSEGVGYYATFSDEVMVFKPDGTGRIEFRTPCSNSVVRFLWNVVAPGLMDLIGETSGFLHRNVAFIVAEKERPPSTGQWMTVLQIALPNGHPNMLGLVTRDLSDWEEPQSNPHHL